MNRQTVELVRLEEGIDGTFGVLKVNKYVYCATLEPSDRENQRNVSSIPAQQYQCARIQSVRYGDTFQVMDVPGRSHILFHAGNRVRDTQGCILLGQYFGKLRGDRAILNSGKTYQDFMTAMKGSMGFYLTIQEVF